MLQVVSNLRDISLYTVTPFHTHIQIPILHTQNMSFIGNSFEKTGRRSSLKEAQELVAALKRSMHEVDAPTTTITAAPRSPEPPIFSNIKTQGRVMIYNEKTFAFKMIHDDHLTSPPDSPQSITYEGSKSLHYNEDSFDFKLAKLSF